MSEFPRVLKRVLGNFRPDENEGLRGVRARVGRRHRARRIVAALAALGVSVAGLFVVWLGFGRPGSSSLAPAPLPGPSPTTSPAPLQRTSPIVLVGSGQEAGVPWSFRAHTSVRQETWDQSLCIDWRFPDDGTETSGDICILGSPEMTTEPGIIWSFAYPGGGAPSSASFGWVPLATQRVEIRTGSDSTGHGTLSGPFDELDLEIKFVAAFAPPGRPVTLIGYDDANREVWRVDNAPLPAVTVEVQGEGSGTVRGFNSYQLRHFRDGLAPHFPTPRIDCGIDCTYPFEPVSSAGDGFVMFAHPDPGSVFAGWTGVCAGQPGRCEFDPGHSSVRVDAVFQPG